MSTLSNKILYVFILLNYAISQSGSNKKVEAVALDVTRVKEGPEERKKEKTSG